MKSRQVSIRGDLYERFRKHIHDQTPRHERRGSISKAVSEIIERALDRLEGK